MPPALGAWAVAIAPGGEPIVARNYIGTGDAKKHALEDCNKLYANCVIVETANTACLSLANDGTNWGIGKAYNPTNSGEKALAACAAITTRSPISQLWPTWTMLSSFVPRPMRVRPNAARSTHVWAPISTSSSITTVPTCGNF